MRVDDRHRATRQRGGGPRVLVSGDQRQHRQRAGDGVRLGRCRHAGDQLLEPRPCLGRRPARYRQWPSAAWAVQENGVGAGPATSSAR